MSLPAPSEDFYQDITEYSGVDFTHTIGDNHLSNIVESVGGGAVFLDFDQDGFLDLYVSNGTYLEGFSEGNKPRKEAQNHLYHNLQDGTFKDEFGTVYRRVGYYADVAEAPLRDKSFEEIKSFKLPDPADPSRFEGIREKAVLLNDNTEYSVWAGPVNSLFYFAWCLRGLDQFMADLYGDPDIAGYLMDIIVDWNIGFFEKFYDEIGDLIDVFIQFRDNNDI